MPTISFHYQNISSIPLKNRKHLKEFIANLFLWENTTLISLAYVFATDTFMLELNKKYLGHDDDTDVITFDLSGDENQILGEIYIGVDTVRANAKRYGSSSREELLRVMLHGALHLCGYADKRKSEITVMRQKEDEYLRLFEEQLKRSST